MVRRDAAGIAGGGLAPFGAGVDPPAEDVDLGGGETVTLGRHPFFGILAGDAPDEFAPRGVPGPENGAVVAPPERGRLDVQPEPAFLLGRPVAGVAAGEDGLDVARELHRVGRLALGEGRQAH